MRLNNFKKRSRFDPDSERAVKGLAFQHLVQEKLALHFQTVMNTREWLLLQDPCLTDIQLNVLEHTWGDIIIIDLNLLVSPVFIECVSINYEKSIFPEHKIKKFQGKNKFYCFGWDDTTARFVHSTTWNAYARKLPQKNNYRKFNRSNIIGLKKQLDCISAFYDSLL
jgi:hypothetical protein